MSDKTHRLSALDFSDKGLRVRLGRVLFRSRNYISAPIFLFLFCTSLWEYENDLVIWSLGPVIILAGEALRLWSMRHIGRSARTRGDKARRLVIAGPYKYVRNPLYLGNHIILFGFCILSELAWFAPVALGICFVFYSLIASYEEELLRQRFGKDYLDYMATTARWIPVLPLRRLFEPEWREAFWRERSTVYGISIGILVFALKEVVSQVLGGGF